MKFLPVIFIVVSFNSFSQDFISVYRDYLPEAVTANKAAAAQIGLSIKAYSDINPELIYYYIKYLDQKLGDTYGDDYFLRNFSDIKKLYEAQKSSALINLGESIKKMTPEPKLANLCLEFIEGYIDYSIQLHNVPDLDEYTDKNLLNFFMIKFYTLDAELKYNGAIDYTDVRKELEQKKVAEIMDMQNNPLAYSRNDLEKLIFNIDILEYKSSYGINTASIFVNIMKNYYESNNLFSGIEIGAGYAFHNDYMFTGDFTYDTPLYSGSDVERKFQMNSLFLSVKYKINFSKYYSPLNLISIRASGGYGLINHSIEGEEIGFWHKGNVDGVSNRSEIFEFSENRIDLKSAAYVRTEITVPVFYLKEFISLDLGGGMNILFTNYEVTYDYQYRKYDSEFLGPVMIKRESGSGTGKQMTASVVKFFPVVSFTFYTGTSFLLHLTTNLRASSIELGLNL
ncbi:MAG TPA: hypothetical protein VKD08_15335 [Ignavibacteriaceae bacterium]|nr:hypothetical protein [Ignavibacteriaceae bacterium]